MLWWGGGICVPSTDKERIALDLGNFSAKYFYAKNLTTLNRSSVWTLVCVHKKKRMNINYKFNEFLKIRTNLAVIRELR